MMVDRFLIAVAVFFGFINWLMIFAACGFLDPSAEMPERESCREFCERYEEGMPRDACLESLDELDQPDCVKS